MAFVPVDGVRLHVQRLPADGPPVVMIHGLLDTLASYYFTLAGPVSDLGFDVITYDLRGHGRSERPPRGYGLTDAAADLTRLLDELDVTAPVHLIGYSLGGTLAFHYAAHHPGRVATLTVIESEPPTHDWARRVGAGLTLVGAHLDESTPAGRPQFELDMPALIGRMAPTARALRGTACFDELFDPGALMTITSRDWLRPPLLLVVAGLSPLHAQLPEILALLPECTVEVIADRDHQLLVHAPREVAAVVLPWLTTHAGVAQAPAAYGLADGVGNAG